MTDMVLQKAVRPRRIDGLSLLHVNRMAKRRSWRIDWFGSPATASVVRLADVRVTAEEMLAAEIDGLQAHVGMSQATAEAVMLAHLGPVIGESLPQAWKLAMFQECLDALCARASNAGLPVVRIAHARHPVAGAAACTVEIEIVRAEPMEAIRLFWIIEAADVPAWAERLQAVAEPVEDVPAAWLSLPIAVSFELGWVDLPLNELEALRTGDVLVPDAWHGDDAIHIAVNGAQRALLGRRVDAGQNITVTGTTSMDTNPETDAVQSPAAADAVPDAPDIPQGLVDIADVAIRITFDLGHARLTLRELAGIAPGHVFDLGPTDASGRQRLTIRANGAAVGDGELVEIQGRIGVAITRIAPPAP